jgi:hypothetical protein
MWCKRLMTLLSQTSRSYENRRESDSNGLTTPARPTSHTLFGSNLHSGFPLAQAWVVYGIGVSIEVRLSLQYRLHAGAEMGTRRT